MYKNMDQTGWYQTKGNKISTGKQILPDLFEMHWDTCLK